MNYSYLLTDGSAENPIDFGAIVGGMVLGLLIIALFYVLTMLVYFRLRKRLSHSKFLAEFIVIFVAFLVSFIMKCFVVIQFDDVIQSGLTEGVWGGMGAFFYAAYITLGGLTLEGLPGLTDNLIYNLFYLSTSLYAGLVVLSVVTAKIGYEIYSSVSVFILKIQQKFGYKGELYLFTSVTEDTLVLAKNIADKHAKDLKALKAVKRLSRKRVRLMKKIARTRSEEKRQKLNQKLSGTEEELKRIDVQPVYFRTLTLSGKQERVKCYSSREILVKRKQLVGLKKKTDVKGEELAALIETIEQLDGLIDGYRFGFSSKLKKQFEAYPVEAKKKEKYEKAVGYLAEHCRKNRLKGWLEKISGRVPFVSSVRSLPFHIIFTGANLPPLDRKDPLHREIISRGFLYVSYYKRKDSAKMKSVLGQHGLHLKNNLIDVKNCACFAGNCLKSTDEKLPQEKMLSFCLNELLNRMTRENPCIHVFAFHLNETLTGDEAKNADIVFDDIHRNIREYYSQKRKDSLKRKRKAFSKKKNSSKDESAFLSQLFEHYGKKRKVSSVKYYILSDNDIDYEYYQSSKERLIKEEFRRFCGIDFGKERSELDEIEEECCNLLGLKDYFKEEQDKIDAIREGIGKIKETKEDSEQDEEKANELKKRKEKLSALETQLNKQEPIVSAITPEIKLLKNSYQISVLNEAVLAGKTLVEKRNELFLHEMTLRDGFKGKQSLFLLDVGTQEPKVSRTKLPVMPDCPKENKEEQSGKSDRDNRSEGAVLSDEGGENERSSASDQPNLSEKSRQSGKAKEEEQKYPLVAKGEELSLNPSCIYRAAVFGFGKTGQEAVEQIYINTAFIDDNLHPSRFIVDVYDRDAEECSERFAATHPLVCCSMMKKRKSALEWVEKREQKFRSARAKEIAVGMMVKKNGNACLSEKEYEDLALKGMEYPCFRFHAESCFTHDILGKLDDMLGDGEVTEGTKEEKTPSYNAYVIALGDDDENIELANDLIDDYRREYDAHEAYKEYGMGHNDQLQIIYVHIRDDRNVGRVHWTETEAKTMRYLKVIVFGNRKMMYDYDSILEDCGGMEINSAYHLYSERADAEYAKHLNDLEMIIGMIPCASDRSACGDGKPTKEEEKLRKDCEKNFLYVMETDERWKTLYWDCYFDWCELEGFHKASSSSGYDFRYRHGSAFIEVKVVENQTRFFLSLQKNRLIRAADTEHERWMRFHIAHGWFYQYYPGKSRGYYRAHKEHDCLIPWTMLPAGNQAKDVTNVALACSYLTEKKGFPVKVEIEEETRG